MEALLAGSNGGVSAPQTYVDDVYYATPYVCSTTYSGAIPAYHVPLTVNAAKGDPSWANVIALVKCDSEVRNVKTNTTLTTSGDVQFSASSGNVTGYSLRSLANSTTTHRGMSIEIPSINFNQAWCIDLRLGLSAGGNGTETAYGTSAVQWQVGNTVNGISFAVSCGDGNLAVASCTVWVASVSYQVSGTIGINNANATEYLKFSSDGTTLKMFFNGVLQSQTACPIQSGMTSGISYFNMTADYVGATASYRLDELRFTFGSARVGEEANKQLESFPEQDLTNAGRCLVWFSPPHDSTTTVLNGMYSNATTDRTSIMRKSSGGSETATGISRCTVLPNSIGFTVDNLYGNNSTGSFLRLFKEKAGFMAIATGGNTATLTHNLGSTPAMAIIQDISGLINPVVFHKDLTGGINGYRLELSSSASQASSTNASITSTTLNCTNIYSGGDAIAYLFADDPSPNGIIRCTSFTTIYDGSATVDVGWEVQTALVKSVNTTQEWRMVDVERGFTQNETSVWFPNKGVSPTGERPISIFAPTTTGFTISAGAGLVAGETYIVLAIRRSNKPPTSGAQVFNTVARTGTGGTVPVSGVGFSPDLVISEGRSSQNGAIWYDKTRGVNAALRLSNTGTAPEYTSDYTAVTSFNLDGITVGADSFFGRINAIGSTYTNWFFKRAVGVFDIVHYNGVAGSSQVIPHNFGVKPQLIIAKCRNYNGYNWAVYAEPLGATHRATLNSGGIFFASSSFWFDTEPTATNFTIGSGDDTKPSAGAAMVAYLFATKAGISKVGSFIGNGASQTIPCGFSGGARCVWIKRALGTDGDWYIWDSVRGIVAGNDPHLSLNTTADEVTTDDSIDPDSSGFIVNQNTATNININGETYIFLAIA